MSNKTTPEIVKGKIKELKAKKQAQIDEIMRKIDEESAAAAAAAAMMDAATDALNVDEYETAKAAKARARTALDMYSTRHKKLLAQEIISEKESDAVINSLIEYEKTIEEGYKKKVSGILDELRGISEEYAAAITDAEGTIGTWITEIHAYYITPNTIHRETGTNRAPHSVRPTSPGRCDVERETRKYIERVQYLV